MTYSIYRNTTLIATVNPTGTQDKKIMGANTVAMSFTLPEQTEFKVGDYVDVYGERYYINFAPSEKEQSSIRWEYSLTMQVAQYDLAKVTYFGYNSTNQLTLPDHDLTGTADTFIDLLIANLNRKGAGGYTKGAIDVTEVQTLQFLGENCLAVLSRLAEVFKTEYWVEGKTIHLSKRGEILPITLKYGQGNGLRKIERVPVDENPPVTDLYVYGGTKNLPANYRDYAGRLQLPISGAPLGYLANPIPNFENEDVYINENIFPERTGVVTGTTNPNQFADSAIDFDINSQLIPGVSAKVKFISGQLSGYQFEVSSYNHATKTIKFNNNTDEKAFTVPSETQKPAIGDKWVIFDIILPQSYIDDAESRLLADGLEYKEQNTGSRYNFNLETDPFHFERNSLFLSLGKYIGLVSEEWGLSGNIRIVGYTRDIQKPYEYPSVEVSHSLQFNKAVIADSKQRELEKAVQINRLTDLARSRANWKTTAELATILETLRAEMLLIMVEGGAYSTDVIATTMLGSFATTAGIVQHEEFVQNGGVWNVTAYSGSLVTDAPYYVYIRADKVSQGATVILSASKVGLEDETGYYHFPFGIISSIIDGGRMFTSLRGYSRTVGGTISTGRIVSIDGLTWFDLDRGELIVSDVLGDNTSGITSDVDAGTESVRFWAGNSYVNKNIAPYRVLQDGSLVSTKGSIGGWVIGTNSIETPAIEGVPVDQSKTIQLKTDATIELRSYSTGYKYNPITQTWTNLTAPTLNNNLLTTKSIEIQSDGEIIGSFKQMNNSGKIAVNAEAPVGSTALNVIGLTALNGAVNATGKATVGSFKSNGDIQVMDGATQKNGMTIELDVRVGGDVFYKMKWVRGILVSATLIP